MHPRVRRVVECNSCMKPRYIYYYNSLATMSPPPPARPDYGTPRPITQLEVIIMQYKALANDRLHDAMESAIFMCGMAALDTDDTFDIL